MKQDSETGAAAVSFLIILFFLSAVAAGAGFFISSVIKMENRYRQSSSRESEIGLILEKILEDLYTDQTPEVNSPDDPVWAWNDTAENGYSISIIPLSDRLNPNFVRKNVFEKTSLHDLFLPGRTADDLQQFREENGLSLSETIYETFFDEKILSSYFSAYGWANINLIDEFAARQLAQSLTGSSYTGESFRNQIQTLLITQQLVDRNTLRETLAGSYDDFFPVINAEPLMNVHFMEPFLLKELIAYPDYNISSPNVRYQEILSLREKGSITQETLANILGIDKTNRLFYYIGCITWFWEIKIENETTVSSTIVCRFPQEGIDASGEIRYQIVEQRYNKK
ncbi:hypothetical protein K7I13_11280 [Brucepastera parasyntrophica]|uniref:hypothetical protein n=1 Tax=Brucepastera parasyntrophica TaxID=2880008 RepID=UPI00210BB242|nr:hypothetical protein [Brucepastera parasyntrophica]ULQ59085.1 hypothetical protein K7I13_11280 [Brucepastera parasyntrophica]